MTLKEQVNFACHAKAAWGALFLFFTVSVGLSQSHGNDPPKASMIDISGCFDDNIVTHLKEASTTDFQYQALSVVDYELFSKIQQDGRLKGLFPYGFFDGSWSDFQEQRKRYFEMNSQSLAYHHEATLDSIGIPLGWAPVIQDCIGRAFANAGSGLSYWYSNIDENKFRLEVKYKSSDNPQYSPKVSSSEIDDGYIEDRGIRQTSLYRDCSSWYIPCQSVNDRNEFIVHRTNPNKAVTVILNISSDASKSTSFDVHPLPKKVNCRKTEDTHETTKDFPPVNLDDNLTGITWGSGGYERNVWAVRILAPGRVAYADTRLGGANAWIFNWQIPEQKGKVQDVANIRFQQGMSRDPDWRDDVIYIIGAKAGDAATLAVTAHYYPMTISCAELDWGAETGPLTKTAALK